MSDDARDAGDEGSDGAAALRDRPLSRRGLLRLGAPLAVETLAGCGSSGPSSSAPTRTGTDATTGETTAESPETPDPLTPAGSKRPLTEKYPGLRVLDEWRAGEADDRSVYARERTPLEEFYVVSHFETPVVDAADHAVTLIGGDGTAVDVDVAALRSDHAAETVTHTMQCAGNGRKYFEEMDGWTFRYGAVGTASWTGVPVSDLFAAHDVVVPDGSWVMAAGVDGPASGADRVFARSIPADKLLDDCLVVYRMNGDPVPLEHGFPVRLLVPGWYGTNSVKWLSELRVLPKMVGGEEWRDYSEWQQHHYRVLPAGASARVHESIDTLDTWTEMERTAADEADFFPYVYDMTVKSIVGHPGDGATVSPRDADGNVEVVGVAWAGDDRVDRVEVSTDGGDSWNPAEFLGPDRGPGAWRRFRYLWDADPGTHTLYSRATDERGRSQPRDVAPKGSGLGTIRDGRYPWNRGGYASNAYEELGVEVDVQ